MDQAPRAKSQIMIVPVYATVSKLTHTESLPN